MGLFNTSEELRDELIQPYIDEGFEVSKVVDLFYKGCLFLVDTKNKKFAYTNQKLYKDGIVKIYNFKDLIRYDNNSSETEIGSSSVRLFGSFVSTTKNNNNKRKIVLYLDTDDIDNSTLTILDCVFNSQSIIGMSGNPDKIVEEITKVLEYILNHK